MRILTIAPFYRWFIKDPTETIAKHIEEVTVLVHRNYLSTGSRTLVTIGGGCHYAR